MTKPKFFNPETNNETNFLSIWGLTQIILKTLKLEYKENPVKGSGPGQQNLVHFTLK